MHVPTRGIPLPGLHHRGDEVPPAEGRPEAADEPHLAAHQAQAAVLRIRIHMFLGLPDPDPDPLVRGMDPDPDPSIIMQK
jgi:hypothetical protein